MSATSRTTPFSPARGNTPSSPLPNTPFGSTLQLGLLGRDEETTYHRRMRTLLLDHASARRAWENVVSQEASDALATLSTCATELDDALALSTNRLREEAIAAALDELTDAFQELETALARMDKPLGRLQAIAESSRALLIEATLTKGAEFTISDGLWGTWTMENFVLLLSALTRQYVLQSTQLSMLHECIRSQGCAPGCVSRSFLRCPQSPDSEGSSSAEEDSSPSQHSRKAQRGRFRQHVMEQWSSLPLIEKAGSRSGALLDEICKVEVGRWIEGK